MYAHNTQLRPRYAETDQMGYVYYGVYPQYFEVGRAELVRTLGFSYGEMETLHGVMLPVVEMNIKYRKPSFYDDLLTIHTWLEELPQARIRFHHRVEKPDGTVACTGFVELAFVDMKTNRATRAPAFFLEALARVWQA